MARNGGVSLRRMRNGQESSSMKLIVKAVFVLVILGFVGLVGFAYLGDLSPKQAPVSKPVVLDGQ